MASLNPHLKSSSCLPLHHYQKYPPPLWQPHALAPAWKTSSTGSFPSVKDLIERETPAPRIFRIRSSLPYENPITTSVLKPGPARRVDPGLGPVRVEAKTRSGVGLVKPGRFGGSTRNPGDQGKPGWDPACFFFIYI